MKKKKNPSPGILDWIVDIEKGMLSPLTKIVPRALNETMLLSVTQSDDILAKIAEAVTIVVETMAKAGTYGLGPALAANAYENLNLALLKVEKYTPEDTWASLKDSRDRFNTGAGYLLGLTAAASAVPLGSIGDAIDEVWRLPYIQTCMEIGRYGFLSEFETGMLPLIRRHWLNKYTPLLPEPYRLADMAAKEIIDIPKYDDAMAQGGLDKDWGFAWREIMYNYPSVEACLAMLRRGIIDTEGFNLFLTRQNMPHWVRDKIVQLKEVIPPLPDAILFAVREAYGTHTFEEQYPAYEKIAGKMGLTKEAAGWYWWSHWIRITVERMFDNYYRGYWTKDKLSDMLRLVDIHPDDREDIIKVAYRPLTIREMGYAYDVGAINHDDIKRYRMWGGLSPEDADKAATALIDYRLNAERAAIRREYLTAYALERIDEAEFTKGLEDMRTPAEAIPLWIERGKLQRIRRMKPEIDVEYRIITSTEAKWMYEHGLKDEAWLREKLADLDWNAERIDVAVVTIKQKLIEKEAPPEVVEYRKLTVTQIRDLWRLKKITDVQVPAFLEAIGYSPEDAAGVAQIIMYAPPDVVGVKPYSDAWARRLYGTRLLGAEELFENYRALDYDSEHATKLTLSTLVAEKYPMLVAQYRKGWITDVKVLEELVYMGMEGEDAIKLLEHTIQGFQLERIERERDLTKAEVVKGVKKAVIRPEEGVMLLQDLGYAEWEAMFILDINRVVAAGDPEGYWEMRRVVESYKKARGEPYVTIPDEVLMLETAIKEQKEKIEKMRAEEATDKQVAAEVVKLQDLETRLKQVLVKTKLA